MRLCVVLVTVYSINGASFHVSNTLDAGAGSLRQALLDANALADAIPHAIIFDAPLAIALKSPLPALTQPVIINSTNQADVIVDGSQITTTPGTIVGLKLVEGSTGSTIQSITLRNFQGMAGTAQSNFNGSNVTGILIQNSDNHMLSDITIRDMKGGNGSVVTITTDNQVNTGNGGNCIGIKLVNSSSNTIDNSTIAVSNGGDAPINDNGNSILIDGNNSKNNGNGGQCIAVILDTASNNTLSRNTLTAGNGGVGARGSQNGVVINGNNQGGNNGNGGNSYGLLLINGAQNTFVSNAITSSSGGKGAVAGINTVNSGVLIRGDNTLGIQGKGGDSIGVHIVASNDSLFLTNTITTNNGGDSTQGTALNGNGVFIGGTNTVGHCGNGGNSIGIYMCNSSFNNKIDTNIITTGIGGEAALSLNTGNFNGIEIQGPNNNSNNGNGGNSIGISFDYVVGNIVTRNTIAVNTGGNGARGGDIGVLLSSNNIGNNGNGGHSIAISLNGSLNNELSENTLSTRNGGKPASAHLFSVSIAGDSNGDNANGGHSIGFNLIGSSDNIISNNTVLAILDGSQGGTTIITGSSDDSNGNGGGSAVMQISNGSNNNNISQNRIPQTGIAGLPNQAGSKNGSQAEILIDASVSNSIISNFITGNSEAKAIQFVNNANNNQQPPVITAASVGLQVLVSGFLNNNNPALAQQQYTLEFFNNGTSSDSDQGRMPIGKIQVTTDILGNANFMNSAIIPSSSVAVGNYITATATLLDAANNPTDTSVFSNSIQVA